MATTETAWRAPGGGPGIPRRVQIADLLRAAAAGDQPAWDELVARYSGLVWSITRQYRLESADAGDVFQTVWLRLVEHIDGLTEPRGLAAWLGTTTRRECLRVLRCGSWQVPAGDALPETADAEQPEVDATLLRSEQHAALWQAFSRLRPSDQQLLRLLVADPAPSYDEIAAALDMPRGSIGPTRRRCLDRLRAECDRQGADGEHAIVGT